MNYWNVLDLFKKAPKNTDIIRFIRTEYSNEVQHLHDNDVVAYYELMLNNRRIKKCHSV